MLSQGYWLRIDMQDKTIHIVAVADSLDEAITRASNLYPKGIVHFRNRILDVLV